MSRNSIAVFGIHSVAMKSGNADVYGILCTFEARSVRFIDVIVSVHERGSMHRRIFGGFGSKLGEKFQFSEGAQQHTAGSRWHGMCIVSRRYGARTERRHRKLPNSPNVLAVVANGRNGRRCRDRTLHPEVVFALLPRTASNQTQRLLDD